MTNLVLHYTPNLSPAFIGENLSRLLVPGSLCDLRLARNIDRLAEIFHIYTAMYPYGLWAPGLALTHEMRAVTNLYLPMAEVRKAFNRFFPLALRYPPSPTFCPINSAPTWLDALQRMQPCVTSPNPATLLHRLLQDENFRNAFIFTLFLPKRHGGNFSRYPGQTAFIRKWLEDRRQHPDQSLRCLDAACGTGETTYELALLLLESGLPPERFEVHGATIEPLELFAAAHIYFPHDPKKQAAYRNSTEPLFTAGSRGMISFILEDITLPSRKKVKGFDLILCNGLLGGPFINTYQKLTTTVAALAGRLNGGGIILAADTFHQGWKKIVPLTMLNGIFRECGLQVQYIAEGIVAHTINSPLKCASMR
jgi:chemotaxis methyl-accepting protein methylase